jgi:hypothetical protein
MAGGALAYTLTLATVAPITAPDPLALKAAAHASRVAPVVAKSSTSRRGLPPRSGTAPGECPTNVLQPPQAVQVAWRLVERQPGPQLAREELSLVEPPLPEALRVQGHSHRP